MMHIQAYALQTCEEESFELEEVALLLHHWASYAGTKCVNLSVISH